MFRSCAFVTPPLLRAQAEWWRRGLMNCARDGAKSTSRHAAKSRRNARCETAPRKLAGGGMICGSLPNPPSQLAARVCKDSWAWLWRQRLDASALVCCTCVSAAAASPWRAPVTLLGAQSVATGALGMCTRRCGQPEAARCEALLTWHAPSRSSRAALRCAAAAALWQRRVCSCAADALTPCASFVTSALVCACVFATCRLPCVQAGLADDRAARHRCAGMLAFSRCHSCWRYLQLCSFVTGAHTNSRRAPRLESHFASAPAGALQPPPLQRPLRSARRSPQQTRLRSPGAAAAPSPPSRRAAAWACEGACCAGTTARWHTAARCAHCQGRLRGPESATRLPQMS